MFNEIIKERYLSETGKSESTQKDLRYKFNRAQWFEDTNGRDLSSFSAHEIASMYKAWFTPSLGTLVSLNANFSSYTDWMLKEGLVPDSQNHYREFTGEALIPFVYGWLAENKVLNREQVLDIANALPNPSDSFAILALFEGIKGDQCCDLYYAELGQFEGLTHHGWSGRDVEVSAELVEYAALSSEAYAYHGPEKDIMFDPDDGRILKRFPQARKEVDGLLMYRRVATRITRLKEALGLKSMTVGGLIESGRIDMVKRLMEEGEEPRDVFLAHREEIEAKYGKVASVKAWALRYGHYVTEG